MTALAGLLGGLGLFLLGTWLMTEGLKAAAGSALRDILERWTRSPLRGLMAGFLITALVRSSSAVTVAAIGFVNAGLLSLTQAVWVVFGTNVGTTTTAWLVAFIGIRFDIAAMALPMLGLGMMVRLVVADRPRTAGLGQTLAGLGCFFLGIQILQDSFAGLAPRMAGMDLPDAGPLALLGFVLLGVVLTLLTQASSAAIAIVLTASAGGAVPLELAAAAVVGTNIGTTSTALLAALGATAPAKRVAAAHIAFNLLTGAAALLLLPLLVALSAWLPAALGAGSEVPTVLAVFHTLFNLLGVLLVWPIAGWLVRWLSRRFASAEEALGQPRHLDATLLEVPELAGQGLLREVGRMLDIAGGLAARQAQGNGAPHPVAEAEAVARLGQEVRGFIAKLNARLLPPATVESLPHLLRAAQHAEAIAADAARLGPDLPPEAVRAAGREWAALRAALLEILLPVEAGPDPGRAEAAYQAVKRALLAATARGALSPAMMDVSLLQAQRLRRVAAAVLKARRRLRLAQHGGPAGQEAEPMHDAEPEATALPEAGAR